MALPRGIRNNNPLNIRLGDKWLGLEEEQNDSQFCQFIALRFGLRAGFIILYRYLSRKIDTTEKIINTWAPSSENNTESYIKAVLKMAWWGRYDRLRFSDKKIMCALVQAMIIVECGQNIDYYLIENGYEMAKKSLKDKEL